MRLRDILRRAGSYSACTAAGCAMFDIVLPQSQGLLSLLSKFGEYIPPFARPANRFALTSGSASGTPQGLKCRYRSTTSRWRRLQSVRLFRPTPPRPAPAWSIFCVICRRWAGSSPLPHQMRSRNTNKFSRRYDFGLLPEARKIFLIARHQIVRSRRVRTFHKHVVIRIARDVQRLHRSYRVAVAFDQWHHSLPHPPANSEFPPPQHFPIL